jgi:hypothetical protein
MVVLILEQAGCAIFGYVYLRLWKVRNMSTITFDTHEFINPLKSVGFSEEQAEVFAARHRRIIGDNLVTKERLDLRLRELEYRLIIKLGGMMMASVIIVVAALVKPL